MRGRLDSAREREGGETSGVVAQQQVAAVARERAGCEQRARRRHLRRAARRRWPAAALGWAGGELDERLEDALLTRRMQLALATTLEHLAHFPRRGCSTVRLRLAAHLAERMRELHQPL
eukprot:scaffold1952_cov25-Tisochrysis_lutea.AAC.2